MKEAIGALLLFLVVSVRVFAVQQEDSVRIYFPDGKSELYPSLLDNQQSLDKLAGMLQQLAADSTFQITSIRIEGHASPSGTDAINQRLSKERARQLMKFVRRYVVVPDSLIEVESHGVDWQHLEYLVMEDSTFQEREEVLRILRRSACLVNDYRGRQVDVRKLQLMRLQKGMIYWKLNRKYFTQLRNSIIHITVQPCQPAVNFPSLGSAAKSSPVATVLPSVPQQLASLPASRPVTSDSSHTCEPLHRLAIKTNLLYDAILMPSLEVEYRINEKWSVNLEGDMAWWKNDPKHKYYQLATVSPEGRYWFKTQKPWHGQYIGAFGGFSWYDLENGHRGYKGEAVTVGLSYGYMFPIGRNLSLEAGIGVGYLFTKYEEYLPIDGCYVYQQTKQMNYFGPLKLKFALVWRLWDQHRKGGCR